MTAGGPNEYGDDSPENRFKPNELGGEAYFVIVNKKTGKTEVWNEEFGQDRLVGTLDPETGKFKPAGGILGKGARDNEAEYFTKNTQVITQQAQKVIIKEKVKEEGVDGVTAAQEAKKLLGQDLGQLAEQTTAVEGSLDIGENTTTRSFVYPESLRQRNNAQDTLQITMIEYVPSGFDDSLAGVGNRNEIPGKSKERAETVILPIPGGIRAENSTDWNSNEMTALDAAKAQFLTTTGNEGVEAAIGGLKDKFDKANMGQLKTALISALASGAGSANPVLARTSGQIFNPNMELLFSGPAIRNFSFDFQFAPRNDKEAKTVLQIIRFFKQGMAPIRSEGKLFLKTPNVFELKYTHKGGEHKGLNKFKECALTNCTVDYTPDGNYSTFEDGIMTSYQMSLAFQELEPIYSDDYGRVGSSVPAEIGF